MVYQERRRLTYRREFRQSEYDGRWANTHWKFKRCLCKNYINIVGLCDLCDHQKELIENGIGLVETIFDEERYVLSNDYGYQDYNGVTDLVEKIHSDPTVTLVFQEAEQLRRWTESPKDTIRAYEHAMSEEEDEPLEDDTEEAVEAMQEETEVMEQKRRDIE